MLTMATKATYKLCNSSMNLLYTATYVIMYYMQLTFKDKIFVGASKTKIFNVPSSKINPKAFAIPILTVAIWLM